MIQLYIGNKNYSSWSMRPWVLLQQAGIPFEEVMIRFDAFTPDSQFKAKLKPISPTGKVPVLVDGDLVVWDTLAIAEYVAEQFPDKQLWPADKAARARARSLCAEMHSGFTSLRNHCPMNIEASLPDTGALLWRDQPGVRDDVARLVAVWQLHSGRCLLCANLHPAGDLCAAFAAGHCRLRAARLRPAGGQGLDRWRLRRAGFSGF